MEDLDKARLLAETMVDIGAKTGRRTTALVTNMDRPLGHAVGNAPGGPGSYRNLAGKAP